MELEKTNRMNALFSFYANLLTEKQMNYLELYYADDYSLGEIAEEYQVSRQAVYDNLKRSSKLLENYERRLHLYSDYVVKNEVYDEMEKYFKNQYPEDEMLPLYIDRLREIEEE